MLNSLGEVIETMPDGSQIIDGTLVVEAEPPRWNPPVDVVEPCERQGAD